MLKDPVEVEGTPRGKTTLGYLKWPQKEHTWAGGHGEAWGGSGVQGQGGHGSRWGGSGIAGSEFQVGLIVPTIYAKFRMIAISRI